MNEKPERLTVQQKLDIREMQIEMMNITIEQERVVKVFEELKKKKIDLEGRMKQYSSSLGSQEKLERWALNDKLEWVENEA